jgi:penicillin-binding protein 1A
MWMTFMRAAIANKPDEKFPEGGAPKKQLDVPVAAEGETPQAKEPESQPDEPDDAAEPQANAKPVDTQ